MKLSERPLSPHLQIYKLPLTGLISISHRITGVILSLGLVFFVYSLSMIAGGNLDYQNLQNLVANPLITLLLWLFIYALFFHFCHGIRHLIWDAGHSFDKATLDRYAQWELIASGVLTLVALIFI